MIEFENSWAFAFLLLPFLVWYFIPAYQIKQLALRISFFDLLTNVLGLRATKGSTQLKPSQWQKFSLIIGWFLLVIAMAKPVMLSEPQTREVKGRDLMVIVDLSGSMDQKDFNQNVNEQSITRLDAAKQVLDEFSRDRDGDRLGLIVFGDYAYVQTPFTADLNVWRELLNETRVAMAGKNTHLGDAIGLGIKHFLDNGDSAQRVMIVLTDGNDTDSLVPPIEAAKVAATYDVKIHMIAMGDPTTTGEQELDMEVISQVAKITGGESYLALSPSELEKTSKLISELEPSIYQSYIFQAQTSLHYIPILLLALNHLIIMTVYSIRSRVTTRKIVKHKEMKNGV